MCIFRRHIAAQRSQMRSYVRNSFCACLFDPCYTSMPSSQEKQHLLHHEKQTNRTLSTRMSFGLSEAFTFQNKTDSGKKSLSSKPVVSATIKQSARARYNMKKDIYGSSIFNGLGFFRGLGRLQSHWNLEFARQLWGVNQSLKCFAMIHDA